MYISGFFWKFLSFRVKFNNFNINIIYVKNLKFEEVDVVRWYIEYFVCNNFGIIYLKCEIL